MTKQQYEQARLAGRQARESGRGMYDGPKYAMGAEGAMLREAWRDGWQSRDSELSRKSGKAQKAG